MKTKPGREKESTWNYTYRSIIDYQSDFFSQKTKQKANAQRGRLLERLIKEKMQFTIYMIRKIISEPPKEVWLNFLDKALLSVKEYSKEIEFAALQFEDLRAEVDKMAESFALRVDVN